MIIGLGHTARVGKDTCAALLIEHHAYRRVAFADALREFVYRTHTDIRAMVDIHGWEAAKQAHPSVRRTLVEVGDNARQILGDDVWIRAALLGVKPRERVVVTDVRYPNEVDAIRAAGGIAVKVTRPGFEQLPNVADQALAEYDGWDYVIENAGTQDDLRHNVDALIARIRRGASWGATAA